MKINSITTYTAPRSRQQNRNYVSLPAINANTGMQNDTVSFGSRFSDEAETMAQDTRNKHGFFKWHVGGGYEEELKKAQDKLDKKALDNEIDLARKSALIEAGEKHLQAMKDALAATNESQMRADEAYKTAQKAKDETIIQQGKVVEANQQLAAERELRVKEFEKLLNEQKELAAKNEADNKRLMVEMKEAMKKKDLKMQEALNKQGDQMREIYEKQLERITAKMTNVSNVEEIFRKTQDPNNLNGFAKISGYHAEKEKLKNLVGNAVALEKSRKPADVPNGILFFGPKGNGKSTFAEALAGQLDCRIVKIPDVVDDTKNMENIIIVAKQAQENFEKDGVRTIIQIDEFDEIAPKGSRITGALKGFMDDVSKKYHCTVFATTNHPENIDDILLRDGRFKVKVGLPIADKPNALAVLKHYGKEFADKTVNFEKLAEKIVGNQPNEAFSNDRIRSVVHKFIEEHTDKLKMSHNDFLQSIKEQGPDVMKEALDKFAEQIKYVKRA